MRTPGRALSLSNVRLPATPREVVEAADRAAVAARRGAAALLERGGGASRSAAAVTRASLSSVRAALLAVAAFELLFLRRVLLPDRLFFSIPAPPATFTAGLWRGS